jgi:hypothetical protein
MIQRPKGTEDVLPKDIYKWHYIEDIVKRVAKNFGYTEIRTPIFEHTELFERGVGDTTDVVEKEMYTFIDRGNRSVTLKPEGTAPVARALIEHKLYADTQPVKMFYITPVWDMLLSNTICIIPVISLRSTNIKPPRSLLLCTQPDNITSSPIFFLLRVPHIHVLLSLTKLPPVTYNILL